MFSSNCRRTDLTPRKKRRRLSTKTERERQEVAEEINQVPMYGAAKGARAEIPRYVENPIFRRLTGEEFEVMVVQGVGIKEAFD